MSILTDEELDFCLKAGADYLTCDMNDRHAMPVSLWKGKPNYSNGMYDLYRDDCHAELLATAVMSVFPSLKRGEFIDINRCAKFRAEKANREHHHTGDGGNPVNSDGAPCFM